MASQYSQSTQYSQSNHSQFSQPNQYQFPSTPVQSQPSQPPPVMQQQPQPQPSVIRCQLIPPSHMPRPHLTNSTPVFGTPSSSPYHQSQNWTQSTPSGEEDEQDAARMEKNYKTMNETDCIELLTSSIDAILKDTCNNAFRQEMFRLLEAETSDDAAQIFKDKLTALCAKE